MQLIPLLAGAVGALFATAVYRHHRARRRPYQLTWAAALALFAVAALLEAAGTSAGWSPGLYRAYYLAGAILNVGWLGAGTVQLLAPARAGRAAVLLMALVSLVALPAVLASRTDPVLLQQLIPGRGAISAPATYLAPLTNVLGSIALVGGAAWSAAVGMARRGPAGRVAGTGLIAAGAFLVAATHSLAQIRATYAIQPAGELLGISLMFAGYLAVESARPAPETSPQLA